MEEKKNKKRFRKYEFKFIFVLFFIFRVQINLWMDELADQYDFAETEIIGKSYEGRDLKIIKLCKGGCGNKPAIWLDGGK